MRALQTKFGHSLRVCIRVLALGSASMQVFQCFRCEGELELFFILTVARGGKVRDTPCIGVVGATLRLPETAISGSLCRKQASSATTLGNHRRHGYLKRVQHAMFRILWKIA